ncbi:hypothetical protein DF186_23660, partial [Enterococcus hirae]
SATSAPFDIPATSTFTITTVAASGTEIENSNSTTDVPTNYEQDDHTGFRVLPGELKKDGYGQYTAKGDSKHPQDRVKAG